MPAPTNISAATAIVISSLPYANSQQIHDTGVTYPVWYKYTPPANANLSLLGFGTDFNANTDVYLDDAVTLYLDLTGVAADINRPYSFPVVGGETYYFLFYANSGDPNPANLDVSLEELTAASSAAGSFLVNNELDNDFEFPLTVLSPTVDNTTTKFVQLGNIVGDGTRGTDGLPHGEYGIIFNNGNFVYGDEQYLFLKYYDLFYNEIADIRDYETSTTLLILGISDVLQRLYIAHKVGGNPYKLNSRTDAGVSLTDWTLTGVTVINRLAVDDTESIMYYTQGGASAIKRWDLLTNVALSDLVATDANFDSYDLLVLEDDTILICLLGAAGTPRQVLVRRYNTAGTLLNEYDFGTLWRSELNVPRIGFSFSSTTFWILLKPEADYGLSYYRLIRLSDGVQLDEVIHTNYLIGKYLGAASATPTSGFGAEKSGPLLVTPLAEDTRNPGSGLYILTGTSVPVARHDEIVDENGASSNVMIPNPFAEFAQLPKI